MCLSTALCLGKTQSKIMYPGIIMWVLYTNSHETSSYSMGQPDLTGNEAQLSYPRLHSSLCDEILFQITTSEFPDTQKFFTWFLIWKPWRTSVKMYCCQFIIEKQLIQWRLIQINVKGGALQKLRDNMLQFFGFNDQPFLCWPKNSLFSKANHQ